MKLIRDVKSVDRYITDVEQNSSFGVENITVEHRSNNPKRDFLFVNKKQCKHIPTSGVSMVDMCKKLAKLVNNTLANTTTVTDKVLVVGFAETATAIGNVVADYLCCDAYVMQTTRENVAGSKQLISFEEEHSHATTQKLLTYQDTDTDEFLEQFKYVLFVEDEISTGNTILNFIKEFSKIKSGMKYGVASVCNWQSIENRNKFRAHGIDTFALITGVLRDTDVKMIDGTDADRYYDSSYNNFDANREGASFIYKPSVKALGSELFREERLGHSTNRDFSKLFELIDKTLDRDCTIESVRVVGTEEFMYIPIKAAEYIEEAHGLDVICHSTTRSPIDKMKSKCYGCADAIVSKNKIPSVYEDTRVTYLYNVEEFTDMTILITDGKMTDDIANAYYELFKDTTRVVVIYNL